MTTSVSAVLTPAPFFRAFDANGNPLAGGKLYTYLSGTTTPQATYIDSVGTPNTNPVILDANGQCTVYLDVTKVYRFDLQNAAGASQDGYPVDNIRGGNADGSIRVDNFGAVGNGTTDDTAAFQAAFAACPNGGTISLTQGKSYKIVLLNVTGKAVTITGGATIITSGSSNGAIYKADHGNKLTVRNITFTGVGPAIKFEVLGDDDEQYDEFEVDGCTFALTSGFSVSCNGTWNAKFLHCSFMSQGASGITFAKCVSPVIVDGIFMGASASGKAIYYAGIGAGKDAGLVITDCNILGWDYGLDIHATEFLDVKGSTIDYCNHSIKLTAQNRAQFRGCYIGSLNNNPALWLATDSGVPFGPTYCQGIVISGNQFVGHQETGSLYDCIQIDDGSDYVHISHNVIAFYTRYGISFTVGSTRLLIEDNSFLPRTGLGVAPIYNQPGDGDSGVHIIGNQFDTATTLAAMHIAFAVVTGNLGCPTENQGSATITATQVVVAHGLAYTPSVGDYQVSPANNFASRQGFWATVDATNITINALTAVEGSSDYSWSIRRRPA